MFDEHRTSAWALAAAAGLVSTAAGQGQLVFSGQSVIDFDVSQGEVFFLEVEGEFGSRRDEIWRVPAFGGTPVRNFSSTASSPISGSSAFIDVDRGEAYGAWVDELRFQPVRGVGGAVSGFSGATGTIGNLQVDRDHIWTSRGSTIYRRSRETGAILGSRGVFGLRADSLRLRDDGGALCLTSNSVFSWTGNNVNGPTAIYGAPTAHSRCFLGRATT